MVFESPLAESVFRSKYLLETETEPEQAIERVVQSVAKVYPEIESETREYISKQWFVPAGGIWRAAGNPNKNVSHINCTNLGHVEDNLESIFDNLYKWGKFAAFGQGEGIDISHLRPRGSMVHNSSQTATGAVSFMYMFDAVLKIISQKSRRGASLISIQDNHPDIMEFIGIKDKDESDKSRIDTANISIQTSDDFMRAVQEDKEWILTFKNKYETIEKSVRAREVFDEICKMAWKRGDPGLQFIDTWRRYSNSDPLGYPLEASNACLPETVLLLTDGGQTQLKDIKIGDEVFSFQDGYVKVLNKWSKGIKKVYRYFTKHNNLKYIDATEDHFILQENNTKIKIKDALYLYTGAMSEDNKVYLVQDEIINKEYLGEMEVFDITVSGEHHTFSCNNYEVHNCGEIPGDKYNVCLLSHINLAKYHEYGHEGFVKLIKFGIKFLNACRMNEINEGRAPVPEQLEKIKLIPRIGLGDTGFADYLIDRDIPYASSEAIKQREYIGRTMAKYSYETGYELAKQYGNYPAYDKEKILKSQYIQRLLKEGVISDSILDYQFNVQYLTIAPVGSGSIIANCGGSGIEPLFSRYMVRRERATSSDWKEHFIFNPYVERYLKNKGLEVTKENADTLIDPKWVMSFDVDALDKINLVAEAQKWIDSSISITFNLPETATIESVKDIYMEAWKKELKGVTVYREGSLTGVLVTEHNYNKQQKDKKTNTFDDGFEKRPESLECDIYESKYKENKLIVLVGLKNGEPYEVFITPNTDGTIDLEKHKTGKIVKKGPGHYDLVVENGVVKIMINNIGKTFDSMYGTLSRMISMSLRHQVPLQFIVDQLNKDSGFIAFEKVLSRILKKYIKDNTTTHKKCPICGANIIYVDGCQTCETGDWSKCD